MNKPDGPSFDDWKQSRSDGLEEAAISTWSVEARRRAWLRWCETVASCTAHMLDGLLRLGYHYDP